MIESDDVSQLAGKYPGLISKKGQFGLDEIANMHGYESDDALFHDLLNSETKNEFLDRYVEDAKRDWGVQIGLTPEEWQRIFLEKENEVFSELTRSTPDARARSNSKEDGPRPRGLGRSRGRYARTGRKGTESLSSASSRRFRHWAARYEYIRGKRPVIISA